MKMFKRITAAAVAFAAVASMSTAMAYELNLGDYDKTSNQITATVPETNATFADQVTVAVVKVTDAAITDADIMYIDQFAAADYSTELTDMKLLGTELAEGTYEVRVGCSEGTLGTAQFTVTNDAKILYGDVDQNGEIDGDDALQIMYYLAWMESVLDTAEIGSTQFIASDINDNDEIDGDDALEIMYYLAWMESALDTLNPIEY